MARYRAINSGAVRALIIHDCHRATGAAVRPPCCIHADQGSTGRLAYLGVVTAAGNPVKAS